MFVQVAYAQTPKLPFGLSIADAPPVMLHIAYCESHQEHFNKDGTVKRGKVNPKDVGYFQINERYHLEQSIKQGFDIYTQEGNIGYALWLYKKEGTTPWNASKKCWTKSLAVKDV